MSIAGETKEIDMRHATGYRSAVANNPACAFDVAIYENEIPDFVERDLERLYESVYCTMARFRIYGEAHGASTYVARSGTAATCVILFRLEGRVVKVVNQQIALSAADLRRFSQAVFARYPQAQRISFYAIDTQLAQFPYPFQQFEALEENVLALPSTADDYRAMLSANLGKRLQSAERKLKRDFPQFKFEVLAGTQVSEAMLRKIVGLAGARMAAKQQDAYIREADIASILRVIHAYGYAGVFTVDGEVRAGNVFYGVGRRYFMHIIAHDPDYDKYMLGHLVQYLAACHCITLGGRECCLMGGGRENKARFGAHPTFLCSVDIYRSRTQRLLSMRRVWGAAAVRGLHQARHDFTELAEADSRAGRLAARCLALVRWARQFRQTLAGAAK
jgi:hypothetical protein